jgi:hypothetical protein
VHLYPCVVACADPVRGTVTLQVEPRGESVIIANNGIAPFDLGDYILKLRWRGIPGHYVFGRTFPPGSVLGPKQSFTYASKRRHRLADHGGVIELRSYANVLVGCDDWGWGNCLGRPRPH